MVNDSSKMRDGRIMLCMVTLEREGRWHVIVGGKYH